MEFTKASSQFSRLEDGSYKVVAYGQWKCYAFVEAKFIGPKATQDHISSTIVHQFSHLLKKNYLEFGGKIATLPNPAGPPDYKISPTIKPQNRLLLESSTFDQCGSFEPSLISFGTKQDDHFSQVQKMLLHDRSSSYTKAYVSWLCGQHVGPQLFIQIDLYDIRSTQFGKENFGKTLTFERTMTRKMTRELEQLISGSMIQYKGVRWRPKRKHPWIAEIKISKRKMWIGDFDTPEEAAQAFDFATISLGRKTTLNFEESLKDVFKPTIWSKTSFEQNTRLETSLDISTCCCAPFDNYDSIVGGPNFQSELVSMQNSLPSQDLNTTNQLIEPNDTFVLEGSHLCDSTRIPQHRSTYDEGIDRIKPYCMFANDLLIMGNYKSFGMQGEDTPTLASSQFDELLPLMTFEGEDIPSVENRSTDIIESYLNIEDFDLGKSGLVLGDMLDNNLVSNMQLQEDYDVILNNEWISHIGSLNVENLDSQD